MPVTACGVLRMVHEKSLRPNSVASSLRVTILFFGLMLAVTDAHAEASPVDHSDYAALLEKHVRNRVVDYSGFKADEGLLDRYLRVLEAVDPTALSRENQFAFYINAYNAWTIKLILSEYPGIESIKELGFLFQSPWEKPLVRINGETLTLDDIEHRILRPRFKDPRVHFAINCASKSCPPLRPEPYRGEVLESQLTDATTSFLNDPENYRFDGSDFFVSRIFDWFGEDFNNDPVGFYRQYAQGDLRKRLEKAAGGITVRYMDYDWSLNGR